LKKFSNKTKAKEDKPIETKSTKPEPEVKITPSPKIIDPITEKEMKSTDWDIDEGYPLKEFSRKVLDGADPTQLLSIGSNLIKKPSHELLKLEEQFSRNPSVSLFG